MNKQDLIEKAKPHYDELQIAKLNTAIDIASTAHKDQKRKSGEAYITHPLSVASILVEWGMDIDSVIAGVLHDTVEDTDITLSYIDNIFGRDVASLVDGVTKVSQARSGMRNLESYLPQTRDNLSKLLIAVGHDVRVIIIKLADRLHNLRTLQYMPKDKQQKIARESLEVFAPMADRLGMGRIRMQIEEIAFSYLNPKEYQRLKHEMKKRVGKSTKKMSVIQEEVKKALEEQRIPSQVDGRIKSVYSLYKKLVKVNGNIDNIYDLIALRVVVDTKEQCYQVLGILHTLYQPMIRRIKDYISVPKPNGYQSLHTTVITPSKQIVEFQIRTSTMHEYAERGLAASFHYHEQKSSKNYINHKDGSALPAELQWITQLQEIASRLRDGEEISRDQLSIDIFGNRIFVFSPKGDIYNLPEGALPLDFAYLVHSEVAKYAYSFKVNGSIRAFNQPLENGDIVEVITKRLPQVKKSWLSLVTTSHAKNKLKTQLRRLGLIEAISQAGAIIYEKTRRRRTNNKK
jgi:GTP pyrophosphokinase